MPWLFRLKLQAKSQKSRGHLEMGFDDQFLQALNEPSHPEPLRALKL